MARLIIRYPNSAIKEVEFDQPRYRIGSGPANDLLLEHEEVEQQQAEIETSAGAYTLVDVSEKNSTTVNGKNVERVPLNYGDRISFGPVVGLFYPPAKSKMSDRAKVLLYLGAGGTVILLSIVFIFMLTTRQISSVVNERMSEPSIQGEISAGTGSAEETAGGQDEAEPSQDSGEGPSGVGAARTEAASADDAGQSETAPGFFENLFSRGDETRLDLPKPDANEIRSRSAKAVPRGLRRLFFRKTPVPVHIADAGTAAATQSGPDGQDGADDRAGNGAGDETGAPEQEQTSGRDGSGGAGSADTGRSGTAGGASGGGESAGEGGLAEGGESAGEGELAESGQTEQAEGVLGSIGRAIARVFSGRGREALPRETLPEEGISAEEQPFTGQSGTAANQEQTGAGRQSAQGEGADSGAAETAQDRTAEESASGRGTAETSSGSGEAARDFQKVTDPLAAIRKQDIPELRDLEYVEEPVYGDEPEPATGLLDNVPLATVQGLAVDVLWSYPPAFQKSAPIVRTPAVGRVDEDKHPDIVFGNAANRLVVLDGAQGVELFSLELEGPFLDPVVVDLDGDRENEIIVVYENGVIQRFDRSLNLQWSHTGDRITTAPLIADLNDDGTDDLVVPTFGMEVVALDGSTGFEMWRFYDARTEIVHPPVGLELNRDRVTDVLFATRGGMLHALDGATGWGLWKRTIHGKPAGSPVPADLDDSGSREIVCVTDTGVVTGHSTAGDKLFAWELEARFRTPPSLGDIDRDGVIEIVMVDQDTVRVFAGNTRREKWSYNLDQGPVIGRIALADCNGEKGMEVVVSTVPGAVYVLDGVTGAVSGIFNGRSYNFTTPLLVDTNSDRINEMVVGSYDGQVYALQIAGVEKPLIALTRSGWKSVNHDPLNTGFSERVLRLPGIR